MCVPKEPVGNTSLLVTSTALEREADQEVL
jgi:hypothetical protein